MRSVECCFCLRDFETREEPSCIYIEGRKYAMCPDCDGIMACLYDGDAAQRRSAADRIREICIRADCAAAVKQRVGEIIREALDPE